MPDRLHAIDPHTPPLRLRDERAIRFADTPLTAFRFNVLDYQGREVWVAALWGKPAGDGPFPGIVHIHGGGQTASAEDAAYWIARGYAVVSFDWTGPAEDRDFVTHWAGDIGGPWTLDPRPEAGRLWHATAGSRRAITFLESRPEVDADRIGAYGISWGGLTQWLVNGTDTRLKAAVAVYGCGGLMHDHHSNEGYRAVGRHQWTTWTEWYDPISYAATQRAPVLFLNGTNDFFGWPAAAARLFGNLSVPTRAHFSRNFNHHVEPPGARAADAFFDWALAGGPPLPETPAVEVAPTPDGYAARVSPDAPETVEGVEILTALGDTIDAHLCWRQTEARREGDSWCARLPESRYAQRLSVIAEVRYRGGHALSSVPQFVHNPEPVEATPREYLWRPGEGLWGWTCGAGTQLYQRGSWFELAGDAPEAEACLLLRSAEGVADFAADLRRPTDPMYAPTAETGGLEVVFECPGGSGLALIVQTTDEREDRLLYRAEIGQATDGLTTARFTTREFTRPDGEPLTGWRGTRLITLAGSCRAGAAVRIHAVRWR